MLEDYPTEMAIVRETKIHRQTKSYNPPSEDLHQQTKNKNTHHGITKQTYRL